jgi:hypothetical protein
VLDGIEVRDAEGPRDQAAGRGAAAGSDRDALVLRPVDEVGDDQEVAGEPHLLDDAELEGEPLLVRRLGVRVGAERAACVQAVVEAAARIALEHVLEGLVLRHRVDGELELLLELEVAARGDVERRRDGAGHVRERLRHLRRVLHVELVGLELPALLVGEGLPGLDAEERLVRGRVLAREVVTVVRADERQPRLLRELDQLGVHDLLLVEVVVLDLQVEAVLEDGAELLGRGVSLVALAGHDAVRDLAAEAARERDDAAVQVAQQLLVDARLVVEAFLEARRNETAEVSIAVVVHGEQDQVVVPARLVVVDAAFLVEAASRRDVGLAADDRLHAVLHGLVEELDRAEHVAVVGDGARRHAGGLHARQELLDLVRAVEQRKLRVQMQMDERHRPAVASP